MFITSLVVFVFATLKGSRKGRMRNNRQLDPVGFCSQRPLTNVFFLSYVLQRFVLCVFTTHKNLFFVLKPHNRLQRRQVCKDKLLWTMVLLRPVKDTPSIAVYVSQKCYDMYHIVQVLDKYQNIFTTISFNLFFLKLGYLLD